MKYLILLIILFLAAITTSNAQWVKQSVNTTASLRGLSVVNEKIVWASGAGGTVIRTIDGGKTWKVMTVPGAEKLDFRDIEAFSSNTAYILSIGNGESSRIYKTTDGGKTWDLQFKNANEKAFFDAVACWDKNNCVAMSDPVDRKFVLFQTKDGGKNWSPMNTSKMPEARVGEAAFAASGTCLITQGRNNLFLVSGGSAARVFRSNDRGRTWSVADTPIVNGTPGSGIFSIAMYDLRYGVIAGGNYEKPDEAKDNLAFTVNGGMTWTVGSGLNGYRSGVFFVDRKTLVAVGTSASDISRDGGRTWSSMGKESLNSVAADRRMTIWAVGPAGLVVRKYLRIATLN